MGGYEPYILQGGITMLQKNIDKEKRKSRPIWVGYAPKKTPTKKEKMKKLIASIKIKESINKLFTK